MHLVYRKDSQEISIFVQRRDADLPDAPVEVSNGCGLHGASVGTFQVAGLQSQTYTVLVVSDLSRAESLRIAKDIAAHLA